MLQEYKAVSGQSIYDICTIVYGDCNNLVALCVANGISDPDRADFSGVVFTYDTALVANQALQTFLGVNAYGTNYIAPAVEMDGVFLISEDDDYLISEDGTSYLIPE